MYEVFTKKIEGHRFVVPFIPQVNHIVSNGVPVMLADKVSTKNAIDFIHNVESAALAASSAEGGNESESSPSRESIPPLAAAPA